MAAESSNFQANIIRQSREPTESASMRQSASPSPTAATSECMKPLQIGLLALEAIQVCQQNRVEEAKSRIPALKYIPYVEDDLVPAYEAEVKRLTDALDFTLGLLEETRNSLQQTLTVLGFEPSEKVLSPAKIGITLDRLGQKAYDPSLKRLLDDFFEYVPKSPNAERNSGRSRSLIPMKREKENSVHDSSSSKRRTETSSGQTSAP